MEALTVSEEIQVVDTVEVLEEAVGKSSFDDLLDNKDITLIGKALRKTYLSLNDLTFKKAPKGAYKFSKARERFLNKVSTDETYGQVVVFVNPETNEYLATVIVDFDLRNDGSNKHMVLATNLELQKPNVNVRNYAVNEFESIDLDKIQKMVNDKATVAYFAEVPEDSKSKLIKMVDDRQDSQKVVDKMEIKSKKYRRLVAKTNNPTFKKAKEMLASIDYELEKLDVVEKGDEFYPSFSIKSTLGFNKRLFALETRLDRWIDSMDSLVFDDVAVESQYKTINLDELDEAMERLNKTAEVAKFLASIKVKDILVKE